MIGLILTAIATLCREFALTIGKDSVEHEEESIYSMGFLNAFLGAVFIVLVALFVPKNLIAEGFPGGFVFDPASLPTLSIRIVIDLILAHITLVAIIKADRSTFGFLRILTIPLLLVVDLIIGYALSMEQILGIFLVVVSLVAIFWSKGVRSAGSRLIVIGALLSVATASLYKYNITNFNSVETEIVVTKSVILIYLFIMALFIARENPFRCMRHGKLFALSFASGISSVLMSFAYLYAPTSVITTGKRSFALLWSMISGNLFFHEHGSGRKLAAFIVIVLGIILLSGSIDLEPYIAYIR